MVCVPCFIIPVLLYVFHRFIQPLILRFWNPWEKKDSKGNVIKTEPKLSECKDGVCSFAFGQKKVGDSNEKDGPIEAAKNDSVEKKHK